MSEWSVKQNDEGIPIKTQLLDENGVAVNITGCTVDFHMRPVKVLGQTAPPPKVNASATVLTPLTGIVQFTLQAGDTDTVGKYDVEWQVNYPTSEILTFPNDGYDRITIVEELA